MTSEPNQTVCPDCGAELPPNAVLCVACGLNLKTGQKMPTQMGQAAPAKDKAPAKSQAPAKDKPQAASPPKKGAIIATLVAVVVLAAAVGGFVVLQKRGSAKPAAPAGPAPEQVAADWHASLATAMENTVCKDRLLTVKGPRLAAEPVAAALGANPLVGLLAAGLPSQSLTVTVAFVGLGSATALPTDPLENTSDQSVLRLTVQAGEGGSPLFSREFSANVPEMVNSVPGVPDSEVAKAEADRAAVDALVGEIPALLVNLALASGTLPPRLVDELETWLKAEDASRLRTACLLFAAKPVRPQRIPPQLAALLTTTTDPEVRHAAIAALGAYGGNAVAALPALTALLEDPDPRTQSAARLAVASIKVSQMGTDLTATVAPLDTKTARQEEKTREKEKKREDDTVAALMAEFEEAAAEEQAKAPPASAKPKGSWADMGKLLFALFYALH